MCIRDRLAAVLASSRWAPIHAFAPTDARSTASTASGFRSRNSLRTTMFVITNFSSGHRDASSSSTSPPSATSFEAVGSGTQAPSTDPERNASGVTLLSLRTTVTSPLPLSGSIFQPCSAAQLRNATSWVLPSCGVAIRLPSTSSSDVTLSGSTTSFTPPEAAPPTIRRFLPSALVKPLTAGDGPRKAMSREPELRASIADGPALKTAYFASVPPSSFWKKPFLLATSAVPWVRLPKYPIRTESRPPVFTAPAATFTVSSSLAWEP